MTDPEYSDRLMGITPHPCEGDNVMPVPNTSSESTLQQDTGTCNVEMTLIASDSILSKKGDGVNETNIRTDNVTVNEIEQNLTATDREENNDGEVEYVHIEESVNSATEHTIASQDELVNTLSTSEVKCSEEDAQESLPVEANQTAVYTLQEYKFENSIKITGVWKEFCTKEEVCMRGCKWSPDGTCILTNSDDNILRVFDLPRELHCQESWQRGRTLPELEPALRVSEGGLVYDYCWYPLMSSWNPLSCCLVSTSKDSPVHLWDAFTGELRCTYRAYNAVDEVDAALSLAFSPSGEKLYCGFKNFIRIFNTNLPGRQCENRNLKHTAFPTERQTGIISCISVNPAMPNIYAAGSYNRSIGVYSEPNGTLLCLLVGHSGGVTHLQFSPDGTKLLSGGRKDSEMICWDMRNPGAILFTVQRNVTTNQRIYFDITPDSRYVVSGNTSGLVSIWDMSQDSKFTTEEAVLSPCTSFSAHSDCVNGISIHQQYPILATASGQRHVTSSESESDSSTNDSRQETSLKLWWVGNIASES